MHRPKTVWTEYCIPFVSFVKDWSLVNEKTDWYPKVCWSLLTSVYEFSVLLSILCMDMQQLRLSLSKLVEYVYLDAEYMMYANWNGPTYV